MPMREYALCAAPEDSGKRIDAWLAAQPEPALTRSAAQQLIAQGSVLRNGAAAKKNDKLQAGDTVLVTVPEPE